MNLKMNIFKITLSLQFENSATKSLIVANLYLFHRYCLAHPIPIHSSGVDDDAVLASGFAQRAQDEETPIQTLLPRMVRMADGSGSLHGVGVQVSLQKTHFRISIDKSCSA
jgi:hypothetical protein